MSKKSFVLLTSFLGLTFFILFMIIVIPPLIAEPDIIGAFMAGFVNPYASGYSLDVIITWCILATWIGYESTSIKGGWVCLILGIVPGVALGFAAYLILRERQLTTANKNL